MELTVDQALQQGIAAHNQGNLQEADRLYRTILKVQPKHPDANHNLGLIAVSMNQPEVALPLFKRAIDVNPNTGQFWISYIDALISERQFEKAKKALIKSKRKNIAKDKLRELTQALVLAKSGKAPSQAEIQELKYNHQNGNHEHAEKLAVVLTQKFPEHEFGWKFLGVILGQNGKITEALIALEKAVGLTPGDAETHHNLALAMQKLDRLEEAEASFKKAISLKFNYAEAHNNLGFTIQRQNRLEEAIESYKQAIVLKPGYDEAYINMALALSGVGFEEPNPDFQKIITSILDHKSYVKPGDILGAAMSLLKFEPAIKAVSKSYSAGATKTLLEVLISGLSELPLLLKLMSTSPLANLELEVMLKEIRSDLLSSITEIAGSLEVLRFQSALALQCFTNDYVYVETDNESQALEALEASVKESLSKGGQPSPQSILCLAAYKALHEYEWSDFYIATVDTAEVFKRQVIEPMEETRLISEIPLLQKITDKVSSTVREQYEENPYPRWVNLALPVRPLSIAAVTKDRELRLFDLEIIDVPNPKILIGGCGTGQNSIGTAARFKNSAVLAVDLSLASLGYAKRQTQKLGFRNIEHLQADILDLAKLERQFDIVESSGVLHHMDDPMAGWRGLTDCLKPGGIMKIGLYSELARQDIVKIREEISQSGIGSSDDAMRTFRSNIIDSDEVHHKRILEFGDFYSLSEFRDLLFHVQEHQFTLPQIQGCLSELGLKFSGFELPDIKVQGFKLKNTGIGDLHDLGKWNVYEEANPNTFAGMYQFWCQKVA